MKHNNEINGNPNLIWELDLDKEKQNESYEP